MGIIKKLAYMAFLFFMLFVSSCDFIKRSAKYFLQNADEYFTYEGGAQVADKECFWEDCRNK